MRIIVAPDSYKGSLSAIGVADAMERGIRRIFSTADVVKLPIADGGEGTVEALVRATGGQMLSARVTGPLGEPVDSFWGMLGDGRTAVIEMAAASGLPLVPAAACNPLHTTTYGVGQLILAALDRGARQVILGLGGSATNDAGAGMAQALGVRFYDAEERELPVGGAALARLARIDLSGLDPRLAETTIDVACDVDNPLCGPRGASAVFGPQKGADAVMVQQLDGALQHFAAVAAAATDKDVANQPGAGAAGGLGAGLLFFTNAKLLPGVPIVLEAVGFEGMVREADLVVTGEGSTDYQTAFGKAPIGVAALAKRAGVPTVILSGGLGHEADTVLQHGIDALLSIVPRAMELAACIEQAEELVEAATARMCRLIAIGMRIHTGKIDS
ncbi:glycerate kinase [Paenibacillus whitsoniae]|uniref:Glycerate kinase n=1 Tax=Paenibacillus whitsoniae TaxID=2496558 RepID=A0A3S0AQP6_9BACL|nr:glycerate kinase [Paenibacillus whitsoniae]RTE10196.1 glycerate kinase [Paenibacillus whitsoniae]